MGMTSVEKILARHSDQDVVKVGDVVVVDVDVIVSFDSMRSDIVKIADPDKLVLLFDHQVPAPTVRAANMAKHLREFVEKFGVKNYFPVGQHGISHVLVARGGFRPAGQDPGQRRLAHLLVGCPELPGPRHGPFGDALHRLQGPDVVSGRPDDQDRDRRGAARAGVRAGRHPLHSRSVRRLRRAQSRVARRRAGRASTWTGVSPWRRSRPSSRRSSPSSPTTSVLEQYLEGRAKWPFEPVFPDDDAEYDEVITVDLSSLEPQVVLPNKVANNVQPAREVAGQKVDQAFIGSCANGRLSDFAVAAEIVKGKQVAPGTRFIVTPGSQAILKEAIRLGYVETLMDAGAVVTSSTCGACFGGHMGLLADDEVCITASTRNFKGRMGSPSAQVFMGSPATVAASAITGVITDPREF